MPGLPSANHTSQRGGPVAQPRSDPASSIEQFVRCGTVNDLDRPSCLQRSPDRFVDDIVNWGDVATARWAAVVGDRNQTAT
jgi:hypothetical protein